MRKELGFCIADTGAGVFAEQVLVHMALRLQHFRHAMVGFQSVVHAVTHDVRVEAVAVTNDHEKSDRFFFKSVPRSSVGAKAKSLHSDDR